MTKSKGLKERLQDGETVLIAEGYLFEMERRGYLQAGPFVPEIVLQRPELVRDLSREFVHAGSDVVQAFTFYCNPAKLEMIGAKPDLLEEINRKALQIAREVADETGTLMCGDLCVSSMYKPNDEVAEQRVLECFRKQVEWAVEERADFIVGETFSDFGEAKLCLEMIKKHGKGLPAVITFNVTSGVERTQDGWTRPEACAELERLGADVVGINCSTGPETIIPLMKDIKKLCKGPIAALPVPYRTTFQEPTWWQLTIPKTGQRAFFEDLDYYCCAQSEIDTFGKACQKHEIQYVGLCCGNSSRYFRRLAESFGRKPPASKYSTNMKKHKILGDDPKLSTYNTENLRHIIEGIETPQDRLRHYAEARELLE